MLIAVDFDGTIVEDKYPDIGDERPFATDVLRMLIKDRHQVVLWTMRTGESLDAAVEWCRKRGVEFYAVNSDRSAAFDEARAHGLSCKLNADLFIDDRNVGGLPSWSSIYKMIHDNLTYKALLRQRAHDRAVSVTPPSPAWMFWKKKSKRR